MGKVGRPPEGKDGERKRDYPQVSMRVEPGVLRNFGRVARLRGFATPQQMLLDYIERVAKRRRDVDAHSTRT